MYNVVVKKNSESIKARFLKKLDKLAMQGDLKKLQALAKKSCNNDLDDNTIQVAIKNAIAKVKAHQKAIRQYVPNNPACGINLCKSDKFYGIQHNL